MFVTGLKADEDGRVLLLNYYSKFCLTLVYFLFVNIMSAYLEGPLTKPWRAPSGTLDDRCPSILKYLSATLGGGKVF